MDQAAYRMSCRPARCGPSESSRVTAPSCRELRPPKSGGQAMILREIGGELVHELGTDDISNVDGDSNYVRVQVLTNASVLTREKQLATVEQLTATRRSSHSAGRATIHRRAGNARIEEVAASHASMVSQPEAVTELILSAVEETSRTLP
jgi:hypothetical protein